VIHCSFLPYFNLGSFCWLAFFCASSVFDFLLVRRFVSFHQIARIAAATLVSPKGFFSSETLENENEEDEEEVEVIVEDPGYEAPSAAELLESDAWCHHRSWLSKKGRCQAYVKPEEEEDDEPEEEEDPIENLRDLG